MSNWYPTSLEGFKLRVVAEPEYQIDKETGEIRTGWDNDIPQYTVTLHMKQIPAKQGDWVRPGEEIQVSLSGTLPEDIEDGMLVELRGLELRPGAKFDKFNQKAIPTVRFRAAGIKPAPSKKKAAPPAAAESKTLVGASA